MEGFETFQLGSWLNLYMYIYIYMHTCLVDLRVGRLNIIRAFWLAFDEEDLKQSCEEPFEACEPVSLQKNDRRKHWHRQAAY